MEYLAIQVKTGEEPMVAGRLIYAIENLWKKTSEHFLKGITVLHLCKGVSTVGKTSNKSFVSQLRGYIFIGFEKWDNQLYHLLKSVPGVLKVMDQWKDQTFTTQAEIDRMMIDTEFELRLVIPNEKEALDQVVELRSLVKKAKQRIVERGKRIQQVVSIPLEYVRSLVERYMPEALQQSLNVGWFLKWLPVLAERERLDSTALIQ